MEATLISNEIALPFLLAGKCEVTIKSLQSGNHFTYNLKRKESTMEGTKYIYFVNVQKKGGDSVYAGIVFYDERNDVFCFNQGKKGQMGINNTEIKALIYVMNKLHYGHHHIDVEIYHCGKCGRCGKKLTTPESILTGLGPECARKCGVPHPKVKK